MNEVDVVDLHAEPDREPVKPWIIVGITALLFVGGLFLLAHSGGFEADVYDTRLSAWADSNKAPVLSQDPHALGQRVFAENCAICHQPDGQGISRQYPPLAGSEWVVGQDGHADNHIVRIVLTGLTGPIRVKGRTFNNQMAPWGPVLNDQQIAAVLTYVRNEWGNQAPPISPEFVAKIRAQTKDRFDGWTFQELQAIPPEVSEPPPTPAPSASPVKMD